MISGGINNYIYPPPCPRGTKWSAFNALASLGRFQLLVLRAGPPHSSHLFAYFRELPGAPGTEVFDPFFQRFPDPPNDPKMVPAGTPGAPQNTPKITRRRALTKNGKLTKTLVFTVSAAHPPCRFRFGGLPGALSKSSPQTLLRKTPIFCDFRSRRGVRRRTREPRFRPRTL